MGGGPVDSPRVVRIGQASKFDRARSIHYTRRRLCQGKSLNVLQWLDERGIAAYIRVKENPAATTDLYGIDKFTYVPEENCYICPESKLLKYVGVNPLNRTHLYYSTVKRCRDCSQQLDCIADIVRAGKSQFAGGRWKLNVLYWAIEEPQGHAAEVFCPAHTTNLRSTFARTMQYPGVIRCQVLARWEVPCGPDVVRVRQKSNQRMEV